MSDDRIHEGLDAYADRIQQTAGLAPASEIRRRAERRRRNRAAGAAFAVVLVAAVGVGTALGRGRDPGPPVRPADSASPTPSFVPPVPTSTLRSNVAQLRTFGVDLETGVLLDIADDGVDRWMQVGPGDAVDFTGSAKDDSTEMSLRPAHVTARNSVTITPVAREGMCVTDTGRVPLALQPCREGDAAQTWRIVPAGDSGQFELSGATGIVRVDEGLLTKGESGRSGMQTIRFPR